jgi:S-adenosylmethionine synthetase
MTNIHELPAPGYSQFSAESYASGDLDRIIATHPVTVFGFACNHNDACIPLSLWAAHQLARRLDRLRHEETLPYLLPDGLSQVSIEYTHRRPHRVHTVTLITSHDIGKADSPAGISSDLHDMVIRPVFDEMPIKMDAQTVVHINPEGPILAGGPTIHAGLTGRKTAIDTYGQYSRHGGSALSGKDPSRIERIGAYYARYVAKNVIAAGLAAECEVLLSYTAGQSKPVSVQLETYGSGKVAEQKLLEFVLRCFDFRVGAIIHAFKLHTLPIDKREGMFRKLACYGHMGRTDLAVPWENTDKCSALAELAGL